jgi:L-ascorbate metabolism protein UlaG (beta-lactamase superfamily)
MDMGLDTLLRTQLLDQPILYLEPKDKRKDHEMATQRIYEIDVLPTSAGDLQITFLGHGSLIFTFNGKIFYIDPFGEVADYSKLPKADVVLVSHEHFDHLDLKALEKIQTGQTVVILTQLCAKQVKGGIVMRNGDKHAVQGVLVEAVPAYNIAHKRPDGQPFHPKGAGNGYVLTFGDQRVYVAGDTENIPEMKELQGITCAFLPMNLPYTMTPEMVAGAARVIRPHILYPYHFGDTDTSKLQQLLRQEKEIEVRIRKLA